VGVVADVEIINSKNGSSKIVTIDAIEGPALTVTLHDPAMAYVTGQIVDLWYDPHRPSHARTRVVTTDNDTVTWMSAIGVLVCGGATLVLLAAAAYATIVGRLVRGGTHRTTVCGLARIHIGRGDYRMLLRFADTGDAVWSVHLHHGKARGGPAAVAGYGHWRVVLWDDAGRPYLARQAWTSYGRRLWHRSMAGTDHPLGRYP
jgi:hypothetical protein